MFSLAFIYYAFLVCFSAAADNLLSFLELEGFFDKYDRSSENTYMELAMGACGESRPPFSSLNDVFIPESGWSLISSNEIRYQGSGSETDTHFWLWFWKADRWYLRDAMIKRSYFCDQAAIGAEVKLQGAHEAGIFFRARGTFDFWACLATSAGVSLIWVQEGRRHNLLSLACAPVNGYVSIAVEDQIADVTIYCGSSSATKERELQDMDEVSTPNTGAAGLLAYNGGAVFRNVHFGEVPWQPDMAEVPKLPQKIRQDQSQVDKQEPAEFDLSAYMNALTAWCPDLSVCGQSPFNNIPLP